MARRGATEKAFRAPSHAFSQYNTLSDQDLYYEEDFLGDAGVPDAWTILNVALNTAPAIIDGVHGGVLSLAMDADSNAEDAAAYHNDIRSFDVLQSLFFECRLAVSVLPTTGLMAWGMIGDHHLTKDSVTEQAWFGLSSSGALFCESDDTTNNNDDIATGTTLVAGTYYVFQIDFKKINDVRFYLDGSRVAGGTTFDMSNLTAAEAIMQPYFSVDKGADTGVGTMLVDYVKIWAARS